MTSTRNSNKDFSKKSHTNLWCLGPNSHHPVESSKEGSERVRGTTKSSGTHAPLIKRGLCDSLGELLQSLQTRLCAVLQILTRRKRGCERKRERERKRESVCVCVRGGQNEMCVEKAVLIPFASQTRFPSSLSRFLPSSLPLLFSLCLVSGSQWVSKRQTFRSSKASLVLS